MFYRLWLCNHRRFCFRGWLWFCNYWIGWCHSLSIWFLCRVMSVLILWLCRFRHLWLDLLDCFIGLVFRRRCRCLCFRLHLDRFPDCLTTLYHRFGNSRLVCLRGFLNSCRRLTFKLARNQDHQNHAHNHSAPNYHPFLLLVIQFHIHPLLFPASNFNLP